MRLDKNFGFCSSHFPSIWDYKWELLSQFECGPLRFSMKSIETHHKGLCKPYDLGSWCWNQVLQWYHIHGKVCIWQKHKQELRKQDTFETLVKQEIFYPLGFWGSSKTRWASFSIESLWSWINFSLCSGFWNFPPKSL